MIRDTSKYIANQIHHEGRFLLRATIITKDEWQVLEAARRILIGASTKRKMNQLGLFGEDIRK